MVEWVLLRFSRLLDWGLVVLAIFSLVFFCQWLINFFSDSNDS